MTPKRRPANIILIGFMGSGKTTVGRELAQRIGFKFRDVDRWIERKLGSRIPKLFKEKGERYFRRQEKRALRILASKRGSVIATGGGAWQDPSNRAFLLRSGWCVWLKVSFPEVLRRTGRRKESRPLLAHDRPPFRRTRALFQQRQRNYGLADFSVRADRRTPRQVVQAIRKALDKEKPLDLSELQK